MTEDRQSIDAMLERIAATGEAFGAAATKLSLAIERIEKTLCDMPGKVYATVKADGVELSFHKVGSTWGLYFDHGTGFMPLRMARVSLKARGASLIPMLLEEISKAQQNVMAAVKDVQRFAQ